MPPVAVETKVVKPQMDPRQLEHRKKLESIIFLGRLSKTIDVAGHKFEISTLTNKEQNDIVRELYSFNEGADLFVIRTLTLANSLKSVDSMKLDDMDVFSEEEELTFKTKFHRRMAIIDNMQLSVVEKLYNEYNELLKENEVVTAGDEIKK